MKKLLIILLSCITPLLHAGSPISRQANGQPRVHLTDAPLIWRMDPNDLSAIWTNAEVTAIVAEEFADWMAVPGTSLVLEQGPVLESDPLSQDDILDLLNAGVNPIVLDDTGSVFEDFGFTGSGALAFAGAFWNDQDPTGPLLVMLAVIGGPTGNATNERMRSTILHELGHALGLGHSQVNGYLRSGAPSQWEDAGIPPLDSMEIMHWVEINGAGDDLHTDDFSGYYNLYGDGVTGNADTGAIRGKVLLSDGVTGADGINVVVRETTRGEDSVYRFSASSLTCCNGSGEFVIQGLPPGEYLVEIRDVLEKATESRASYSDPIRTDRPNTSTSGGVIGPFPGDTEFYNGADESNNPNTDDPTARSTVTVTAGQSTDGIEIIFNRSADQKGTSLPSVFYLPQIQSGGDEDTRVRIINPNNDEQPIDVFGFTAAGDEIIPSGVPSSLPANGSVWLSANEIFGGNAGGVAWMQVGSTDSLYVFAELQGPTTRSAYWASSGLEAESIMPHVAKNTAKFDTFIASVNGQGDPANTTLTAQPTEDGAVLGEHTTGYTQSFNNLEDLFGADLTPIDWVGLQSDAAATSSMEYFTSPTDNPTQMAALDLTSQRGTTLRFLHIATDTNLFWTGMVYINISNVNVTATETYYNAAGEVIKTFDQALTGGQKITLLFDANNQERVPTGSAWMTITVPDDSGSELVGYELFGSFNADSQDVFTGLRGNYTQASALDYPHFVSDGNAFTAIVATNVGGETGDLEIQAIDANGAVLATANETGIAPNQKLTALMRTLFPDDNVRANTAWVRVNPTASTWAGFMLWGDLSAPRQFLSGIVAVGRGVSGGSNRLVIDEGDAPHNTYDSAIELSPRGGVFDVNVIGTISQDGGAGPIVNTGGGDGLEDIYKFTLTQTTQLLIAVAPEELEADLDIFIYNTQLQSQNFFSIDPALDPNVSYSASAGGVESVLHTFAPGEYYIAVSLFEGDTFDNVSYGLLVTQTPLLGETFDDPATLPDWFFVATTSDTDSAHNWAYDTGFAGSKYGNALRQDFPSTPGDVEDTLAVSPTFTAPSTGVTAFNFDYAALTTGDIVSNNNFYQPAYVTPDLTLISASSTISALIFPSAAEQLATVSYGDGNAQILPWSNWIFDVSGVAFAQFGGIYNPEDFTIPLSQTNTEISFAVRSQPEDVGFVLDNVRVFNILTSNENTKRSEVIRYEGPKPPKQLKTSAIHKPMMRLLMQVLDHL